MDIFFFLISLAAALCLFMTAAWLLEMRTGASGWIDATWSFAVGLVGVIGALVPIGESDPTWRNVVVATMVAAWSVRLGLHIVRRTLKGGVDPRYSRLKEEWGANARMRMLLFLQGQAMAGFVLVLAVFVAARNSSPTLRFADCLGVVVFVIALSAEALADGQMRKFGADPANKGKVCDVGLWRLSRHPNYFFEWLGWVAYPVIAIDLGGAYPGGWLAIPAPMLMYSLLVHVSGIPPLEEHMLKSRGEAFRGYQRRVNAFWPIPHAAPSRGPG